MNLDANILTDLGFTGLEAQIYCHLVQTSPATGYQVSRALGKPTANTYQAIESLLRKGAVLVDESGNRMCRAVAPREFLDTLQREFVGKRKRAERLLSELETPPVDEGIYSIRTRAQVMERANSMIHQTRSVLLMDVSPGLLEEFRSDIRGFRSSQTLVAIKLYRPEKLAGARVFVHPEGSAIQGEWSGEWLNLIADGREFLVSFFSESDVDPTQAYWSANSFLAWTYHSSLSCEIVLAGLADASQSTGRSGSSSELSHALKFLDQLVAETSPGAIGLLRKLKSQSDQSRHNRD